MKTRLAFFTLMISASVYAAKIPFEVRIQPAGSSVVARDYGVDYDPTVRYHYAVRVKNVSNTVQHFTDIWVGSDNWIIDRKLVKIHWGIARENAPFDVELKPGEEFKRGISVETTETAPVSFRLGFYPSFMAVDKQGPFWSNRVTLHPKPAQQGAPPDAGTSGPRR